MDNAQLQRMVLSHNESATGYVTPTGVDLEDLLERLRSGNKILFRHQNDPDILPRFS